MIGYLEGKLIHSEPQGNLDLITLKTGGVGYLITCPSGVNDHQDSCALWIHSITRDDGTRLYGFASPEDRRGFVMMLDIQGVGAKVALALIAALGWPGLLDALSLGDVASLTRADGVGKKIAERIVHEMGRKIGSLHKAGVKLPSQTAINIPAPIAREALSALTNLGYSVPIAQQAVQNALQQAPDATLEDIITKTLRLLHEQGT